MGVTQASRKISWIHECNPPTHDVTLHAKSRPKPVASHYPEICDESRVYCKKPLLALRCVVVRRVNAPSPLTVDRPQRVSHEFQHEFQSPLAQATTRRETPARARARQPDTESGRA